MKIVILGPAHPYRGGLASIMETMAREYIRRGDEVKIYTFSLQYPSLLFPGKSQTVDTPAPEDLSIERVMNTCNPINWIVLGNRLRKEAPDMILMKYWTPFMAPCFGTICRIARRNGVTKVICQIDNVEPHEHHITDRPFNHYYLGTVDGFVYMSEQVGGELKHYTSAPALFSPHPMFSNFGHRVERADACKKLGLDAECNYLLFFGLIREYKGLDLLLEAFKHVNKDNLKLIVAGEFYESKERYEPLFEAWLASRVPTPAYEICWDGSLSGEERIFRRVVKSGAKLWINTLWDSLCGGAEHGLEDDRAIGHEEQIYGKVLSLGCSIIQTDRPAMLLEYLTRKGRHTLE